MEYPHEDRRRSLVKAILWRTIATFLTLVVVYGYTGKFVFSLKVTVTIAVLSTVAYYVHERIWTRIRWGNHTGAD
jgi:uncharacterized membrane protein